MNKDQALRVIALGKRGCSVDMIKRTIAREFKIPTPYSNAVNTVLEGAGIATQRDPDQAPEEMQRFSSPEELRIRWDKLIEPMKKSLRASIGGG